MNSLLTRSLSAIVAVIGVVLLVGAYREDGLKALCYLACILGIRELNRILYQPDDSVFVRFIFILFSFLVFIFTIFTPEYSTLAFAVVAILFCSISLIYEKRFEDLTALALFQAKAILGFFYVGLLPALTYRIIDLVNGMIWFIAMLAVVFAGDTFAYLVGVSFGKKKLLPNISPKKTILGSAGGLVASGLVAMSIAFYIPKAPLWALLLLGLGTGVTAQLGDLFESMLKRVANRKDSGNLMPGHGGMLDRIDGVLFGAPVFFLGATLIERFLLS